MKSTPTSVGNTQGAPPYPRRDPKLGTWVSATYFLVRRNKKLARHAPILFLEHLSMLYFLQDTNPSLWWNLFSSSQVQGTETASTLLWWNSSSLLFVLSFSSVFLRHFIKDWTSTQSIPARQTRTRNTPMIRVLSRSVSSDSVPPSTLSAGSPGRENVDNL